ncbi:hypothetical protein ACVMGC_000962 [Bradyrhizobium barranii subsp. barranii]|uniref:hypothetical protein n=1 Tax=Bradyrhizobium TaxID=374 RepID=UPI001BABB369|nr:MULTISPECIES: hypothetical protein [Bradyrhizobium]MBR0883894.1 hypothetical protein [Bradyrhizobium liaoningense]MCP1778886.1 hypothetical protein [Bradyrhizobium japonicum]MCP1958117.1 hypothetical protein [Bradyrhizobium japonicum]
MIRNGPGGAAVISRKSTFPSDFHYQSVMVDKQRVIPLIVATALFMDLLNEMDGA